LKFLKITQLSILVTLLVLLISSFAISAEYPNFMGVYVNNNGQYTEVPNIKNEFKKYNFQNSPMGKNSDFNVKFIIKREQCIVTSLDEFNKNGFLVIEDKDWSDGTTLFN